METPQHKVEVISFRKGDRVFELIRYPKDYPITGIMREYFGVEIAIRAGYIPYEVLSPDGRIYRVKSFKQKQPTNGRSKINQSDHSKHPTQPQGE